MSLTAINTMDSSMQVEIFAGVFCVIWLVSLIIWIAIGVWMYKDAKKRDENAVLWLIVGLLLGIIGVIIWLIVRPDMSEVERKRQQSQMGGYYPQQQYGAPQQQQYQQPPPPPQQQGQQCPDCRSGMRYVSDYNRWYCDRCQGYK